MTDPILANAVAVVRAQLATAEAAAGTYADDPQGWHARHRAEMERLADQLRAQFGARITDRWDGARVRLAGLTASSTSGTAGALRNWLRRAEERIAPHGR